VGTFSVWAPRAETVDLDLSGSPVPMTRTGTDGWWRAEVGAAAHGTDYAFRVDGCDAVPDPRSRWQPHGVHGPSRIVDPDRFCWTDSRWRGLALPGAVIYELHVGTFTGEGTFDAAIGHLDHLVDLGVDAVEVMPVAAFPGRHGWGYDGAHLYAVHEPYGGPAGFARFVDAAHSRGLGVVLDVVYNHLGPSGNYLARFGPYFTSHHMTPWGEAVNLDDVGAVEVRRWIVDNALMWLRDYHVDGLRLDAVHELVDDSAIHVLEELAGEVSALAVAVRRPLFLIAESDLNDPRHVTPQDAGGFGLTAQWNDDFHHAVHCLLTGESQGYYSDFAADPFAAVAHTLSAAYFHDGTWSSFRGRRHGRPVDRHRVPGHRFVGYLQNHDQIGNRAVGDRLSASLSTGLAKVGAALLLTSPYTPMLFMGEEWGAATPWQFFTDHEDPQVAEGIRRGRWREFAEHGWAERDVPDPQDPATARRSTLDWSEPTQPRHAELLAWYRTLLAARRRYADLSDPRLHRTAVTYDASARWLVVTRGATSVVCNLGPDSRRVRLGAGGGELLVASNEGAVLAGDEVELPGETVAVVAGAGAGSSGMRAPGSTGRD
jgi:maltooligosyltrehalose trehalohydrolase